MTEQGWRGAKRTSAKWLSMNISGHPAALEFSSAVPRAAAAAPRSPSRFAAVTTLFGSPAPQK